jgi:pilus assembly protein CpaB
MKRGYLYVAVFLLLLTIVLSSVYFQQLKSQQKPLLETKPVVIANQNIPSRTIITATMISLQTRPVTDMLPDAITTLSETIDQVSTQTITAGSQITHSQIAAKGGTFGLPFVIPVGKRAVSIALAGESALAGLLKPGDRVDIVATLDLEEGKTLSTIVLQNISVIAVGAQITGAKEIKTQEKQAGDGAILTLALTPQDAEKLSLIASKANLKLIGRPISEEKIVKTTGATLSSVLANRISSTKYPKIISTSKEKDSGIINMFRGTSMEEVVR